MRVGMVLILAISAVSCATPIYTNQDLPNQPVADSIVVRTIYGTPSLAKTVKDKQTVEQMVDFINSIPSGWSVPTGGSPVGKYYVDLYCDEVFVGNFYVGPGFFGRDVGDMFWSKTIKEDEIEKLAEILNLDLVSALKETP